MFIVVLTIITVSLCIYGISLSVDAQMEDLENWEEYIEAVCEEKNVCPELVQAIIERESSWRPKAVNGNCVGLMQIDKVVHAARMERMGIEDLKDPYDNIMLGVDYLAELFAKHEDLYAVLMFYNAGNAGLEEWENGCYSDYAIEVARRSEELERNNGK